MPHPGRLPPVADRRNRHSCQCERAIFLGLLQCFDQWSQAVLLSGIVQSRCCFLFYLFYLFYFVSYIGLTIVGITMVASHYDS
ncbi:hypothetical protein BREU_1979 [Bifidobacterium reuteri DSM 23975]|uniref:Uncharacterized protein n=1 Tax=Bifidobacterium reuteri DSM 23975 TaxID=1437610 RepID=A0A087CPQ5_9BIFI|nr:hypothetical protein BREU_1979 [Bifidobacterium reuteri DSM 23975]